MGLPAAIAAWDDAARGSRRGMALETLVIFAGFAVAHYLLFGGHGTWTDADAPYHHLVIAEIHAQGFWRDITWLPSTILRDAGPDHHWLWHLLLAPFAAIDDLGTRIDVVNAFSFALVPAATNLAFRLIGIRFAPVWVLVVFAGVEWSLYRWSQARAQNPACVLIVLFIAALARRHKPSLLLVPFVFMHTYHGAALLGAPGVLLFAARWAREKKPDWVLLALPALGGALALVTSPWYPHNIEYMLFHTLDKVGNTLNIDVGQEWLAPPPLDVLRGLQLQLVALGIVAIAAGRDLYRRASPLTLMAAGMTAFLIALTLRNGRFVEYCPQMIVLTAALIVRDCPGRFAGRIRPLLVVAVCVTALLTFSVSLARAGFFRDKPDYDFARNEQVARLLADFAAPGSMILNTRWDDFPSLVWHAPGLRYLSGLDPYYLAYESPDKFLALYRLRGMIEGHDASQADIRGALGGDWLLTREQSIVLFLVQTGQAQVVLRDRWNYVVYLGTDRAVIGRLLTEGAERLYVSFPRFKPKGTEH